MRCKHALGGIYYMKLAMKATHMNLHNYTMFTLEEQRLSLSRPKEPNFSDFKLDISL